MEISKQTKKNLMEVIAFAILCSVSCTKDRSLLRTNQCGYNFVFIVVIKPILCSFVVTYALYELAHYTCATKAALYTIKAYTAPKTIYTQYDKMCKSLAPYM